MPKIEIEITDEELEFINSKCGKQGIFETKQNNVIQNALHYYEQLYGLELAEKQEQQDKDMEFINKVAIEAMKPLLELHKQPKVTMPKINDNGVIEAIRIDYYDIIAEISYKQAKAMLVQSKKVQKELNKEADND